MDRTPPVEVLRFLRKEVGFGCPVRDCGSPYLQWHHFDPPWHVREHHDPDGMIALCGEHHDKADAGAFTPAQLRQLKADGKARASIVRGRFDWMRNRLLVVAGGNFCYETPTICSLRGQRVIWLSRDDDGYLLLNVRMLSVSQEQRIRIGDNYWLEKGSPSDLECPPSGRLVHAKYANEDELRVEFFEVPSPSEAKRRYAGARAECWPIEFPVTAVEVQMIVGQTNISFGPRFTTLGGMRIQNGFMMRCGTAIAL